jgi:hypothetical protein
MIYHDSKEMEKCCWFEGGVWWVEDDLEGRSDWFVGWEERLVGTPDLLRRASVGIAWKLFLLMRWSVEDLKSGEIRFVGINFRLTRNSVAFF